MKLKTGILVLVLLIAGLSVKAQHLRIRLNFPAGVMVGAPGPAPFAGAIWIGPEWEWRNGRYVFVPGYWGRTVRPRSVWIPGHWEHTRRGYRWIPGHWR